MTPNPASARFIWGSQAGYAICDPCICRADCDIECNNDECYCRNLSEHGPIGNIRVRHSLSPSRRIRDRNSALLILSIKLRHHMTVTVEEFSHRAAIALIKDYLDLDTRIVDVWCKQISKFKKLPLPLIIRSRFENPTLRRSHLDDTKGRSAPDAS
jgi:hypothetical protein